MRQLTFLVLLTYIAIGACKTLRSTKVAAPEWEYKFDEDIEAQLIKDSTQLKYHVAATDYAHKGHYLKALQQWDLASQPVPKFFSRKEADSLIAKYKVVSAKDFIAEESKKHQIVIINEAHHNSLHRVFTRSLLKKLYDNGYKNLGLETLTNDNWIDSSLHQRKYPIYFTGYYSRDPHFANLIRDAIEIGYQIFPYEASAGVDNKPREIEQANNIKKEIQKRPHEKFLIHCGFGHVSEGEVPYWGRAMAGRLHEFTGINPLTIDQTQFSERSRPEYNDPLKKLFDQKEAVVLVDKKERPLGLREGKSWTDIAVVHPNTIYFCSRPSWLFDNGNKKVPVNLNKVKMPFPVMIKAYKVADNLKDAVPLDILEVGKQTDSSVLALKPGTYSIVVSNKAGERERFKIKVRN